MLPPTTLQRGAAAEAAAAEYLRAQGLTVLERNLRCGRGELDLVCLDQDTLVIVEVRHRAGSTFGGALASVTRHKQRRILRATRFQWQRRADWRARALRFDVVALQGPVGATQEIIWVKNAFFA